MCVSDIAPNSEPPTEECAVSDDRLIDATLAGAAWFAAIARRHWVTEARQIMTDTQTCYVI